MNVKLSTALASEGKYANISPEKLELMGKQAANALIEKGISLNESISKLAASHNDINQEQIKRVCEFANTAVYLSKHDMAKNAGAGHSYPEFDLADPNRVIQDLSDGTKSTVTTKVDADYSRLPLKEKTSSAKSSAEKALEDLFMSKTASDLDFSEDTAINEVMAAKDQLRGLQGHLNNACEQFDLMFKEASAEFYEISKRHMLDGGSFVDIVKAAQATGADDGDVNNILTPVIKTLISEKVASAKALREQMRGLEKLSHRVVNEEHPLVKAACTILSAAEECETAVHGLHEVEAGLERVNSFIKEKLSARASR